MKGCKYILTNFRIVWQQVTTLVAFSGLHIGEFLLKCVDIIQRTLYVATQTLHAFLRVSLIRYVFIESKNRCRTVLHTVVVFLKASEITEQVHRALLDGFDENYMYKNKRSVNAPVL
jgi:hypothetical protein